jgi:hypothetical protein
VSSTLTAAIIGLHAWICRWSRSRAGTATDSHCRAGARRSAMVNNVRVTTRRTIMWIVIAAALIAAIIVAALLSGGGAGDGGTGY